MVLYENADTLNVRMCCNSDYKPKHIEVKMWTLVRAEILFNIFGFLMWMDEMI